MLPTGCETLLTRSSGRDCGVDRLPSLSHRVSSKVHVLQREPQHNSELEPEWRGATAYRQMSWTDSYYGQSELFSPGPYFAPISLNRGIFLLSKYKSKCDVTFCLLFSVQTL